MIPVEVSQWHRVKGAVSEKIKYYYEVIKIIGRHNKVDGYLKVKESTKQAIKK